MPGDYAEITDEIREECAKLADSVAREREMKAQLYADCDYDPEGHREDLARAGAIAAREIAARLRKGKLS